MLAVLHKFDGKVYTMDIPKPQPKEYEVVVKIKYAGLCDDEMKIIGGSTDYYRSYTSYNSYQGIGHEASGIIEQSCPKAEEMGLVVGTHVTIHPYLRCGTCKYCRNGRENLCINRKYTMRMMCEYVVVDYRCVYKLPDDVSLLNGCLTQPIACVMRTIEQAGISFGQSVAIIGNSFSSIIMIILSRMRGAKTITAVGLDANYKRAAIEHGADYTFSMQDQDDLIRAMNVTSNNGYDVVLEASSYYHSKEAALALLARGGTIVFFSNVNINTVVSFSSFELFWKEAIIKTSFDFPYLYPKTISCIAQMDLSQLTKDIFPVSDVQSAYEYMYYGRVLRAIVEF